MNAAGNKLPSSTAEGAPATDAGDPMATGERTADRASLDSRIDAFIPPPIRVFASRAHAPRVRRPTDRFHAWAAFLGLLAVATLRTRSAGPIDESVTAAVAGAAPGLLDPLWQAAYWVLVAWPLFVVLIALVVRHRLRVVRDMTLAAVLATMIAAIVGRLMTGAWPGAVGEVIDASGPPHPPAVRVAIAAGALAAAAPHLGRPIRRVGTVVLALGCVATVFVEASRPSDVVIAVLSGSLAGALVLVAFGSPSGHPERELVRASLAELGIAVAAVTPAVFQPDGVYRLVTEDAQGPLWVEVFGRDARDAATAGRLWTSLWYRGRGRGMVMGRLPLVEHEATVTMLARQAGVNAPQVVLAGSTVAGDALLVLRPNGTPLEQVPADRVDARLVAGYWSELDRLHAAGIVHGDLDRWHLGVTDEGDACLVGLAPAEVPVTERQCQIDRAQLLATTAELLGADAAVAVAREAVGVDGLLRVQSYLQAAVLAGVDRRQGQRDRLEVLRDAAAAATGTDKPELQQIRRFTWGSLLQVVLLFVAGYALAVGIAGLDLQSVADELRNAQPALVLLALLVGQSVRLPGAYGTIGASPDRLPYAPTAVLQYAIAYLNLAIPSTAARVAINIRYLQKLGVERTRALVVGGLDSFAGFVVQVSILLVVLITEASTLSFGGTGTGSSDGGSSIDEVLVIAIIVIIAAIGVGIAVPRSRRWIAERLREAAETLRVLRSPKKVAQMLGGNLAAQCLSAAVLGLCVRALGNEVAFVDLLVINTMVSLFAGLIPVPGGIGVTEAGLTMGLTAAGIPQEQAFAAALLTRLLTFYLPPIWGFFAFRWLQHHDYL